MSPGILPKARARGCEQARAKWPALALLLGAAALIGPACGSAPAATAIRVEFRDFEFVPRTITAPARTPLRLELSNSGGVEHDINGREVPLHAHVPAGKSMSEDLAPLEPGVYEIWCSVSGHRELGMVGTLEVR